MCIILHVQIKIYKSKYMKRKGNSMDGLMFIPLWDILKLYYNEDQ